MSELLLLQMAEAVLQESASADALLRCWEDTGRQAMARLDDVRAGLARESPEVQQAVSAERRAVEESFERFEQVAAGCHLYLSDFDRAYLQDLIQHLPTASRCLEFDLWRLHEAIWVARGPGAHGGVNRILHSAHGPRERLLQECQLERERLRTWIEGLSEVIPPPLREAASEWGEQLGQWLDALGHHNDDLALWLQQGSELGLRYANCDPHFLWRRYSEAPTPFGLLNVALNSAWLLDQGLLDQPMVDYCLAQLRQELESLRQGHGALLRDTPADLLGWGQEIQDIAGELDLWLAQLQRWTTRAHSPNREALEPIRERAVELGVELYEFLERGPLLKGQERSGQCS